MGETRGAALGCVSYIWPTVYIPVKSGFFPPKKDSGC